MSKKIFAIAIAILSVSCYGYSAQRNENSNESTKATQDEPQKDAFASINTEAEESSELPLNVEQVPFSVEEVGNCSFMQLNGNGIEGNSNLITCYLGKAGLFKNYYVYQFKCYPNSRYGKEDIAALTWCAYNNERGNVKYSVNIPAYVELYGKKYKVERVLIGDWFQSNGAAYRYILPPTIKIINFAGLTRLKEVILKEGIEVISLRAFWGCTDLEKVEIPSTVKVIEGLAFNNCPKLKKIRIPASVIDIGKGAAFIGVSKETVIEVEEGCKAFEGLKANNDLRIKGPRGYKSYQFNPDDLNIVYIKSE